MKELAKLEVIALCHWRTGHHSCIGANEGVVGSRNDGALSAGWLRRPGIEDHPVIGGETKGREPRGGEKKGEANVAVIEL